MSENWGFGNGSPYNEGKPFGKAIIGTATKGQVVDLAFGEHPYSRNDNNMYAKFEGREPIGFDGHRVLIDVRITSSNYLKQSGLSGDEVRKGGSGEILADGVVVFEFFFRDTLWALRKAQQLIEELGEHPSDWLIKDRRASLIGRRVWYYGTPAKIIRLVEDQGCVILQPDGTDKFPPPPWRKAEDWDDYDDDPTAKVEVTSSAIYWFREA